MTETTFEVAKRCPICTEPGRDTGRTQRGPHGSTIRIIECANSRCRWFNTTYLIQTNADGTIPEPTTNRDKSFRPLPNRTDEQVANMIRRATT